jgi:hypothetical protein
VAKRSQEIMEILEAFDLTRSYRSAAEWAGCDPKTVAHHVSYHFWGVGIAAGPRPACSTRFW